MAKTPKNKVRLKTEDIIDTNDTIETVVNINTGIKSPGGLPSNR